MTVFINLIDKHLQPKTIPDGRASISGPGSEYELGRVLQETSFRSEDFTGGCTLRQSIGFLDGGRVQLRQIDEIGQHHKIISYAIGSWRTAGMFYIGQSYRRRTFIYGSSLYFASKVQPPYGDHRRWCPMASTFIIRRSDCYPRRHLHRLLWPNSICVCFVGMEVCVIPKLPLLSHFPLPDCQRTESLS